MKKSPIQPSLAHYSCELLVDYMKRPGVIAHVKSTYGVAKGRRLLETIARIDKALTPADMTEGSHVTH